MPRILKTIIRILVFLILVAIAIGLILFGLNYMKISEKQYIFSNMVDMLFYKEEEVFKLSDDYILGDNFQVEGNLKMNLVSEDYATKAKTDPEYKKKNQMLHNLSLMDTSYMIQHSEKKGEFLAELKQKIGNEEILDGKYYINNSTRYIFVNKVLSNYVNDGNNNYFESYVEDVTTVDNIDYLYNFIRDSIKNNITDDDLDAFDVETVSGETTRDCGQISYRITDKSYKKLLKNVLKDIKSDDRASQIVSLIYPKIDELKVNEKKKYLKKNESYTINIYVTKFAFTPFKYEVVYLKDDQKNIYTYEGDKDKGTFYYSENNEIKYTATYESTSKKTNILVYDFNNDEIGTIKLEKDKDNLMFNMTLDLEKNKIDVTYTMKNKDLEDKTYNREDYLVFKVMEDKVVLMRGEFILESKISGVSKINEDVTSSVIRSSLSEVEEKKLETLYDKTKERLER